MNTGNTLRFLAAYARARRIGRCSRRTTLERAQRHGLDQLMGYVVRHSPFYSRYADRVWADWPVMDKSSWMAQFNDINTVGARLEEVSAVALQAEQSRDFSQCWGRYTVGLSTGTSGNRGVFLVSPEERARWAGTLLGQLMRDGLFARERIALVLRAGATLYDTIGAMRLSFRFFDQSLPWGRLVQDLRGFNPTILVAPASALRLLTETAEGLNPRRVISIAEVLDDLDRLWIQRHFGVPVEQIYQATEGLLGMSCELGTVHLNEPYILVEPEWQDRERTRFLPVVTDLWRRTQPVIRYRLNDILHASSESCACGRAALALTSIEGRSDDVLWLDSGSGRIPIFPDLLTRAIVSQLPDLEDYKVTEQALGRWCIGLRPMPSSRDQQLLIDGIRVIAAQLKASSPDIVITELERIPLAGKQRRVRSAQRNPCAS